MARPGCSRLSCRPVKQRLLNILFWSVISAAFIGPGTITVAASAGAGFGYALLWALVFSTLACMVLQESAARLSTVSGRNLGESLKLYLSTTLVGRLTVYLVLAAILLGCAAYETGNILGAVAGVSLVFDLPPAPVTLAIGVSAFALFWFGSTAQIARVMGCAVAFMGLCFVVTVLVIRPPLGELLTGALVPRIPRGAEMLILGLVGTTVVPYNLFLGSGLANTQSLREMRWSLGIAIGLGGLISMAVLVVGASIMGTFTFEALAEELAATLGPWAAGMLAIGLFGAGLTSAVTAPLAAAITARSMLAADRASAPWQDSGRYYRLTWMAVLFTGVGFSLVQLAPIPAIILAQALNGVILPLVAVFLLIIMNNIRLLNATAINSHRFNALMGLVVFSTIIIGITNLARALTRLLGIGLADENIIFFSSLAVSLAIAWPVVRLIQRLRLPASPA